MSKKQLVFDTFDNKKTERVPVGFWFHFAPDDLFLNSPEIIDRNISGHQKFIDEFQPDFIKLMSDGYFHYPNPTLANIKEAADLKNIKSGLANDWIEEQVELVKKLTRKLGKDIASFYNIFSPASFLAFALGENSKFTLASLIKSNPEELAYALNEIKKDLAVLSIRIILDGGADGIYLSTKNIQDSKVTKAEYLKYIKPSEQGVLNAANAVSDYNILHICGYEGARNDLTIYVDYDVKAINWAVTVEEVSLKTGKSLFGGRAVIGGFNNTTEGVLYKGSKEEIEVYTEKLLKEAGTVGVVLGADCTIPVDTPLERLEWVRKKAAVFGK